jgi:hypothetical protein
MKPRVNVRLSHKAHALLEEMTLKPGVHKSAVLEAAFWAYVDPEASKANDRAILKRLNQVDLRLNSIERDSTMALETLGQFILYWLTRTDPLPDGERDAAHRLGQRRFDYFVEQVAQKVSGEAGLSARMFPQPSSDRGDVFDKP